MDCNQIKVPLIFIQDVAGFMVGKDAEQSGIIRSGAKMVSAVSNSIVPKITIVIGNSFGAGNYVMCGKAYDPNFILAWPNANYAVMGAEQAASTLFTVQQSAAEREGKTLNKEESEQMKNSIKKRYSRQMDIRYGAARGWIDAIIAPSETRNSLITLLQLVQRNPSSLTRTFHTGVFQV
jgi:acetyl-CoA carboxylase carboxyltransferase component